MWCTNAPLKVGVIALFASTLGLGEVDAQTPGRQLDHATALELARANNHLLRAAELRIGEAAGALDQAALLLVDNPEIAVAGGRRSTAVRQESVERDFEIGLEQRIEIGGTRSRRIDLAQAGLAATEAETDDVARVVELAITLAFYQGLASGERVQLAERSEELATDLLQLAQRRLDAGVGTPLELNAAVVRLAEAQRLRLEAQGDEVEVLLRLKQLISADLATPLVLVGELPVMSPTISVEAAVTRALGARPDLQAASFRVDVAEAASRLASAKVWPVLTLGASIAEEEGSGILRAGVRLPLPFLNRNQGNRAAARIAHERRGVERDGIALAVASEVRSTAMRYQQARTALEIYDAEVLTALQESVDLVQFAADAGELSIADVLVVQRALLEGLTGYLDARLTLAIARAQLLAAASLSQTIDLQGGLL